MTDFNKIAERASEMKIHVSPEGLDEEIVTEGVYMVTKTQGGKFRVYGEGRTVKTCDTKDEAIKTMGAAMMMMGMIMESPERGLKLIVDGLTKNKT